MSESKVFPISDIKVLNGQWYEPPMGRVSGTFVRNGNAESFETGFLVSMESGDGPLDIFALDIVSSENLMHVQMSSDEEESFKTTIKRFVNNNMLAR